MTNSPKVLVELDHEEVKWLADLLNNEFWKTSAAKAFTSPGEEARDKAESHQKMAATLMNRFLDKASDQGFGDL